MIWTSAGKMRDHPKYCTEIADISITLPPYINCTIFYWLCPGVSAKTVPEITLATLDLRSYCVRSSTFKYVRFL